TVQTESERDDETNGQSDDQVVLQRRMFPLPLFQFDFRRVNTQLHRTEPVIDADCKQKDQFSDNILKTLMQEKIFHDEGNHSDQHDDEIYFGKNLIFRLDQPFILSLFPFKKFHFVRPPCFVGLIIYLYLTKCNIYLSFYIKKFT